MRPSIELLGQRICKAVERKYKRPHTGIAIVVYAFDAGNELRCSLQLLSPCGIAGAEATALSAQVLFEASDRLLQALEHKAEG